MFDGTISILAPDGAKIILDIGRFKCEASEITIHCGNGHCTRNCNCQNFTPQSENPSMCLCLHSYSDHAD